VWTNGRRGKKGKKVGEKEGMKGEMNEERM
jgi:hypothetical protein